MDDYLQRGIKRFYNYDDETDETNACWPITRSGGVIMPTTSITPTQPSHNDDLLRKILEALKSIERFPYSQPYHRVVITTRFPNPSFWNFFKAPSSGDSLTPEFDLQCSPNFWSDMRKKCVNQGSTSQYMHIRQIKALKSNNILSALKQNSNIPDFNKLVITTYDAIGAETFVGSTPVTWNANSHPYIMTGTSINSVLSYGAWTQVLIALSGGNIEYIWYPSNLTLPSNWVVGYTFTAADQRPLPPYTMISSYTSPTAIFTLPSGIIVRYDFPTQPTGLIEGKYILSSTMTTATIGSPNLLYSWPSSNSKLLTDISNAPITATTKPITSSKEMDSGTGSVVVYNKNQIYARLETTVNSGGTRTGFITWKLNSAAGSYLVWNNQSSLMNIISSMDNMFERTSLSLEDIPDASQNNATENKWDSQNAMTLQLDFPEILEPTPTLSSGTAGQNYLSGNITNFGSTYGFYTLKSDDGVNYTYTAGEGTGNSCNSRALRHNVLGIAPREPPGSIIQQQTRIHQYHENLSQQQLGSNPNEAFRSDVIKMAISDASGQFVHMGLMDYTYVFEIDFVFM